LKPNKLAEPWKGDKRFTAIATRAAALKKSGNSVEAIQAALTAEFGPPRTLEQLRETPQPYVVYHDPGDPIEPHAIAQLELALRLPIAVRGALMPDAHPGYALPVGGVFATYNAVAPAMVGVDIGCRMHLTIFDTDPAEFTQQRPQLLTDLRETTLFGAGVSRKKPLDHDILDDPRWQLTSQLRGLHERAPYQLGTSGSGNHFANLVIGERLTDTPELPAHFCGLLTHSGSRGIGYAIANNYIRLATQATQQIAKVPKMYEWLDLASEAGQEYWQAMELAGDFARACHEVIHASFARRAKLRPLTVIENHHNFAWREGDLIVHRKGATPAHTGELGVIPGSMASASYIVAGRGNPDALHSAAHGAGRRGARWQAREQISPREVRDQLARYDVLVEGLSVEEAPQAYKNIEQVMQIQIAAGLVQPLARLRPIAVIMASEEGDD
jgi:tRNA-splicing ligase RtcB